MIGWILAVALTANAIATLFHALELRRARLRRRAPVPGAVVGPTPPSMKLPDIDEEKWLKSQKQRIRQKLQREFPTLSGKALEDAADQIIAQGRATLARLK